MRFKGRRGLVALAAITASVAVSGIGAGGAQASLLSPCAGANIEGQGSSLQGAAQDIWTSVVGSVGFNNNMNGGCTTSPTVRYTRTSSGQCLNKWHSDGGAWDTTVAYCGTDDAPTSTQITTINASVANGGSGASVLSIPVAQAAIAIVVNPPAGCTISTATAASLEQAFRGAITTWTALGGSGCGSAAITRVRRADSSGTTYQLKHWLTGQTATGVLGSTTWHDLQLASNNTVWPGTTTGSQTSCSMAFPCSPGHGGSGGGDEVKTVGVTSGSLGYAALADARSVTATGTYPTLKWIQVRQGSTTTDPSFNGLSTTKSRSNCPTASSAYGTPPATTTTSWSDVYETTPGFFYPLCTLTWDTALTNYTPRYGASGQAIATTVHDYLGYLVNVSGGQADALASNNDYAILPHDVRTVASAGVAEITN